MSARPRVLIDGSTAVRGGGFTYLVNVMPRLVEAAPDFDFKILLRHQPLADAMPEASNLEVELLPPAGWLGAFGFVYLRAAAHAQRWGADLYYSVAEWAPLRAPFPVIASFRNPNAFTSLDQGWPLHQQLRLGTLRRLAGFSARAGARILFVSEDSSDWIGERMKIPVERRSVVYHGIDLAKWGVASGARPLEHPYFLSVSSIYRYKNFVRLIDAWAEAARSDAAVPDLVIIGDTHDALHTRAMYEHRRAAGDLASRIHLLGEISYADLPNWYAHAAAFAFPSYLETFGHPLIEAMASGLPVLAADTGVFREIGGDAVDYADPHETGALRDGLLRLAQDETHARKLAEAGRARAAEFSWERTAQTLRGMFEDVLAEAGN